MDLYHTDNSVSVYKYLGRCKHRCYISHLLFAAAVKVAQRSEVKFPLMETQVIGEVTYRKACQSLQK